MTKKSGSTRPSDSEQSRRWDAAERYMDGRINVKKFKDSYESASDPHEHSRLRVVKRMDPPKDY